jgi:large subunit ribosomal protein L29
MKKEEISKLSTEDLKEAIGAQKLQLTKLKLSHTVSPLENPKLIEKTRKTVARLLTELSNRELVGEA